MKIADFKKLEKKINGYNFNQSYKNINSIMGVLSYFGNIASIFLAYFFMSKILTGAIDNTVIVIGASLIILAGLELLKRDIFNKLSIQALKDNRISKAVIPLLLASSLLIFASFYSSLNGAKEFSSKSVQIKEQSEQIIKEYSDSITALYEVKIDEIEQRNAELFEANKALDDEARQLPPDWVASKNKIRSRIDLNNEQMEKNNVQIAEIKAERDTEIKEYEDKIINKNDVKVSENTKNSLIFIILSTIIEFVILGGIYFGEYYKFRSYKEMRDRIEKDPNYQRWSVYDDILNVILRPETKVNERLPSNKAIIEMCKVNDIIILPKDITHFTKVLAGLNIIKVSGSAKYFMKSKEIAHEILKKHFNIE